MNLRDGQHDEVVVALIFSFILAICQITHSLPKLPATILCGITGSLWLYCAYKQYRRIKAI